MQQMESAMQNVVNCRWLLAGYAEGMPAPENWTMDVQPVPDPGLGQILVKAKWLSVDPYMRGSSNGAGTSGSMPRSTTKKLLTSRQPSRTHAPKE
jgi:NADPH-dependent curcumin reductase CurA